jgi:hypothetical protein
MYGKLQANWGPAEWGELRDFLDFTVANARRANAHALTGAVHQRAHRLQVEVPAPFGDVMSVADLIAECRLPATYFANLCHGTEISYVNRILSIARGTCFFSLPRRSEIALRWVSARQERASRRNRRSFLRFRARRHAAAKPRASSARLTSSPVTTYWKPKAKPLILSCLLGIPPVCFPAQWFAARDCPQGGPPLKHVPRKWPPLQNSSACAKSAVRSSICSSPIDRRMRFCGVFDSGPPPTRDARSNCAPRPGLWRG